MVSLGVLSGLIGGRVSEGLRHDAKSLSDAYRIDYTNIQAENMQ